MGEKTSARGYGVDPDKGHPMPFTPEERAEFEAWEQLGNRAWDMILEWEREEAARQPEGNDGT